MNSVAGNKERLAVSTRGKKYGVSCGGVHGEMRSQGPIGAGVLRCPGTRGGLTAPQLSGGTGFSTGGAVHAWRWICSSPGSGNVFGPRFLPFPAPVTFAVSEAELNLREAFPRNPSAVPWARCPGAGSHFHSPAGPGGLFSE